MRLLDVNTKEFAIFEGENVPPYIIVSHCWYGEETTLQDFEAQRNLDASKWSPGVVKVMQAYEQARSRSIGHLWVDTCCIDKTSSAELQEAINSMYKWYEKATVCLIYLEDVHTKDDLKHSRWFTRGWTLQELIAPTKAVFIDTHWKEIGDRDELSAEISAITGIPASCLGNRQQVLSRTVAERMSWMSSRKTTRPEDSAYCLLGLFDVNMSMMYGEGAKAFTRLQKQIIQDIDDETVLLWLPVDNDRPMTVLAPSPECYTACKGHKIEIQHLFNREFCNITKYGLEIQTFGPRGQAFWDDVDVPLNCTIDGERCILHLTRTPGLARLTWHRTRRETIQTTKETTWALPENEWESYHREHDQLLSANHLHQPLQQPLQQRQHEITRRIVKFTTEVVKHRLLIS